ncbi:MAG: glycoside hydrolase family 130 protein [bacterium]|nr:MAG: glycoside hydrolase family 130 protein [bacterium]
MNTLFVKRIPHNPIIKTGDLNPSTEGLKIIGVFNPGACLFSDEIILLARVAETCEQEKGWVKIPTIKLKEGNPQLETLTWKENGSHSFDKSDPRKYLIDGKMYLTSVSHLRLMRSKDGVNFTVDPEPFLSPAAPAEIYGVEDVRITRITDTNYMAYTAVSGEGHGVVLASSKDFIHIERHGMIFPPQNKDVCIFPEKIHNKYIALHRPLGDSFSKPSIWYAESPDLLHWGNHSCLMRPGENEWEQEKIGAGPQPIKTPEGWLLLYHGCGRNSIYSLFLCLLDLHDPRKILKRGTAPILTPEDEWEKNGFFPNVVFSNGWVLMSDGTVKIYFGAADNCVCLAETTLDFLLEYVG